MEEERARRRRELGAAAEREGGSGDWSTRVLDSVSVGSVLGIVCIFLVVYQPSIYGGLRDGQSDGLARGWRGRRMGRPWEATDHLPVSGAVDIGMVVVVLTVVVVIMMVVEADVG